MMQSANGVDKQQAATAVHQKQRSAVRSKDGESKCSGSSIGTIAATTTVNKKQ